MTSYILYSTAGCHLCEHAKAIIWPLLDDPEQQLQEVDIAESEALLSRYGLSIPVLSNPSDASKAELNWPFGPVEVQRWLAKS